MSSIGELTHNYTPRPLQTKLHAELRRFSVLVAHRRFGKTVFSANHMINAALKSTLPYPRYAYIAPSYGQAKRVVWDVFKHYTSWIPNLSINEAELRIDLPHNKARIMLLSAENPASLKGIYLDGSILDEFAEMDPTTWSEAIRPTLLDRTGWTVFIGTPKGQNTFYDLHEYAKSGDPEWYTQILRASETGIIPPKELEGMRRTMSEEEYNQEMECSFSAALTASYFSSELAKAEREGRITTVRHDPMIPVDTYWDLGMDDTTAVWFVQSFRGEHRFIDYLEVCGSEIPATLAEVMKKKYNMGQFVLPHDANVRSLDSGRTRKQMFYSLGCRNVRVIPKIGHKIESINAARVMMNKCVFDGEKCKQGLKALWNYQKKWNEKNQTYETNPLHNWASNAADAFQQFALGVREDSRDTHFAYSQNSRPSQIQVVKDYDLFGRGF